MVMRWMARQLAIQRLRTTVTRIVASRDIRDYGGSRYGPTTHVWFWFSSSAITIGRITLGRNLTARFAGLCQLASTERLRSIRNAVTGAFGLVTSIRMPPNHGKSNGDTNCRAYPTFSDSHSERIMQPTIHCSSFDISTNRRRLNLNGYLSRS
jgi:hypothetical protein